MSYYVVRDVEVHQLPLARVTLLHPERCVISIHGETHDIGSLCYRRRSAEQRVGKNKSRLVDLHSFDRTRVEATRKLIKSLSLIARSGGNRPRTISLLARSFRVFVDWCDSEGHTGMFGTELDSRVAFRAYVEHLRHRVSIDSLNVNTAWSYQNGVIAVLSAFLEADDIVHGVQLLSMRTSATNVTTPPDEISQSKVLSLCHAIFTEVTTFVLERQPFPFKLALPNYLNWDENALWIFPTPKPFMTPHERDRRDQLEHGYWAVNYAEGRLATLDEIATRYHNRHNAQLALLRMQNQIAASNDNYQHFQRRMLAMFAHNSFVMLFLANTAMNWAQARDLSWNKDFEVGDEHQGFRAIKYRAGGRTVSFEIQINFLGKFKRFLALREYLVDGMECDTLFLTLGARLRNKPGQMSSSMTKELHKSLRRIDPSLPRILSRKWRAAKSDYLLSRTDPSTTSLMLQNSEPAVLRSYAAGSESRAIVEMGQFYLRLTQRVLNGGENPPGNTTPTSLGGCTKFKSPVPIDASPPITPDCHQGEGCLFCDHYFVHADEHDVRKLLSCKACIFRTAHLSTSHEYFQSIFGEVIKRIGAIITTISDKSEAHKHLVDRVRVEVEQYGQLDRHWERKMETLILLGVVSQ